MSFSWDQTGRDIDASTHEAQQRNAGAAAAARQRLEETRRQYELIQQKLIQPFIAAMRAARSPGLERRAVPVKQMGKWPKMRCWRAAAPEAKNVWLDILPDGRWFYYNGGQDVGSGPGAHYTDTVYFTSEIDPNWPRPFTDGELRRVQEWMVLLLREHGVAVPRDDPGRPPQQSPRPRRL